MTMADRNGLRFVGFIFATVTVDSLEATSIASR